MARPMPCAGSISTFPRASSPCWWGRPAAARARLLRAIAGLEAVDRGTIAIDGEVVNEMRPRDRNVAMVFQNYALYPYMNVYENIAFGLRARRFAKAEIERRVQRGGRDARHRGAARAAAAAAVGRPAPAGRDRPRDRARCAAVPVRRAALQPRCEIARRDAQRAQAAASGARQDDGLRDPRPGRGDDARRPDRAAEGRRDRAGRARRSICSSGRGRASSRASSARRR